MNTEQLGEDLGSVTARARIHAALADPGRLQIIDALRLGDASPSSLAALGGLSSNLVAHHLHTLESAGLVTRHRSEGDRRRTYVRLVPGVLAHIEPSGPPRPERVVFVCTANSARSQLANRLWHAASDIPSVSAGTDPADAIHPGAVAVAQRHKSALPQIQPRHIDEVLTDGDLEVTVCDRAHESHGGAIHWSVPDPVAAGTTSAFERAWVDLSDRVSRLAQHFA